MPTFISLIRIFSLQHSLRVFLHVKYTWIFYATAVFTTWRTQVDMNSQQKINLQSKFPRHITPSPNTVTDQEDVFKYQ